MTNERVERFELEGVSCTLLRPKGPPPWPICLFLFGGGGSAETLVDVAPLLEGVEMAVACAGVPPLCFYLEPWERLVGHDLLSAARARCGPDADDRAALVGISMGGYGALRIAFDRPEVFHAVAAVAPMIEPFLDPSATPPRNRFHYPAEVPAELRAAEHPASRALRNADRIRRHDLAVAIDAGSRDALNAHDGAEVLHRVLWELDVPHEYCLLRDADHVGPTIAPRLGRAFRWVEEHLRAPAPPDASEVALRAMLAPARAEAAREDPTVERVYGVLDRVPE